MLQIQFIRDNSQEVIDRLAVKNFDAKELVEQILQLDAQRRQLKKQLDDNLAEQNSILYNYWKGESGYEKNIKINRSINGIIGSNSIINRMRSY